MRTSPRDRPMTLLEAASRVGCVLVMGLFVFCNPVQADEAGTTRIGIVLFDGVLTSDVVAPMEVFGNAIAGRSVQGYEVVTVAPRAGRIRTLEGVILNADYSIDDAPALDAIIVGSGIDMDALLDDEVFMAFIRERGEAADWLASNCSGAYILAEAGFLRGRRATTYPGGEVWLKLNHPSTNIEIDETVVVDGNVVTSNGGLVSYEAALTLLGLMAGEGVSERVARSLYFNRLLERGSGFPR
jgi:transcriptional regulator GlxA family with amidase domain